jgi:hypothetical protein
MGDAALPPLQLMDVLQPWAGLLAADPAAHLEAFLAAAAPEGRGEPPLEEVGAEVERLRGKAAAVAALCSDDVHTGGWASVAGRLQPVCVRGCVSGRVALQRAGKRGLDRRPG